MENGNYDPEKILSFSVKRNITTLFKSFLVILENLGDDHAEALTKLYKIFPPEYQKQLYLADHFTPEKLEQLRKQILSTGNDVIRTLEQEIEKYNIKFK